MNIWPALGHNRGKEWRTRPVLRALIPSSFNALGCALKDHVDNVRILKRQSHILATVSTYMCVNTRQWLLAWSNIPCIVHTLWTGSTLPAWSSVPCLTRKTQKLLSRVVGECNTRSLTNSIQPLLPSSITFTDWSRHVKTSSRQHRLMIFERKVSRDPNKNLTPAIPPEFVSIEQLTFKRSLQMANEHS